MPDIELIKKIERLKKERKAIILSHNYQIPEVQDIADFVGDSLELSKTAAKTDAEVIVFCGVHFMAETAKILSPEKTVLLPDETCGCPLADMITREQLIEKKKELKDSLVVCYINSSAEVKAESDYCCTSVNAIKIIESIDSDKKILFVPDKYLGSYVRKRTKRNLVLWNGYCPTHLRILKENIIEEKRRYPEAIVMVHPECTEEVIKLADKVLGTGGMCRFAMESDASEFIIGTELGLIHRLKKENPDKKFYPASDSAVCPNMKKINLEKILWALSDLSPEIKVSEEVLKRALSAINRMLEIV